MKRLVPTFAISAALLALPAAAQPAPVFHNAAKQIQTTGSVNPAKRVVVLPTAQVKWMTYGKVSKTASPHMFSQNVRSARSTTEVIGSVDAPVLKALADALYKDLADQLAGAGWEVVTADAMGADAPKWATMPLDPVLGLASDEFTYDAERRYAVAAPAGMPILKMVGGGRFLHPTNGMAFNKLSRDGGVIAVPTYIFDTAELDQSTRQGFNNVTATTSAQAALLISGSATLTSARGVMTLTMAQPAPVAEDVGALRAMSGVGDDRYTATMRFLGGLAKVSKAAYVLEPDQARLQAEALRAGKAFNSQIVARLK
ncbi:MAG: hypothetical protein U1C74_04255 [Phenylobacterium sp.]|nr:hypothetical protein [Phenylobacterium sp.]